jgi:type VI secretion system protein ImpG
MLSPGLDQYFQNELRSLREDAARFGDQHPGVAQDLKLARGLSRDPQVELLLQSFAYLTGRLNFRLDEERGMLSNVLLGLLYPHLQAPLPAMAVAHVDVKPDGANFVEGWTLKRNRYVYATAPIPGGAEHSCRFATVYDTPLVPLRVDAVELAPANEFNLLPQKRPVLSVLRVRIGRKGNGDIKNLRLRSLRFHIHGSGRSAYRLYELLALHCSGVAVRGAEGRVRMLEPDAIRWLGFEPEEAALPGQPQTHPGFRLLQEYFAFREKFLFFDVNGIDAGDAQDELQLLFLLDTVTTDDMHAHRENLWLNCVPLVNLYPQRLEPLRLTQRDYEYRLVADRARHRYTEIHTLIELCALQPDGSERELAPYFAAARYDRLVQHDYFYLPRRTLSLQPGVPGTELYVSFIDLKLQLDVPPGDAIVGHALCTNRRLPEHFGPADRLELEGAGPIESIHLLGQPSLHRAPQVLGNAPWALLAQLAPSFMSLSEQSDALGAFKRMLTLHCSSSFAAGLREIDAIQTLTCRPSVRRLRREDNRGTQVWGSLARGLEVLLNIDNEAFAGGSALLFGEVLQRFLAQYVAVNSFAAVSLQGTTNGVSKTWPPTAGDRPVL